MRCLLSIDAGGTKCQTVAVKEDGTLVGWGRCGFLESVEAQDIEAGSGRSIESVTKAIRQALRDVNCTELHVTGYYRPQYMDGLFASDCNAQVIFHPLHESDGILQLAGVDFGIIASAGTGAFVHVVGKDGNHLHLDSLGPVLGDYGSAYHIGVLAVQAAAKCDWHPRHHTSLKRAVHQALRVEEKSDRGASLIWIFERVKDRAAIADLARIVNEEAENGDRVARAILEEAASALAETVYDAYDSQHLNGCGYSLVGTGGVIERSDIYWQGLCRRVAEFAPDLTLTRADLPHVVGTALAQLQVIANGDLEAAKGRLITCAREVFRTKTAGADAPASEQSKELSK
jgi:N-acetylglucosamine kinase-like BadF-type ATPase